MMELVDSGMTAALVGIIVVLLRIVEGAWKRHNQKNGNGPKAHLDPEQSRQLREMHEKFIILSRDIEDMRKNEDRIAEALSKIADCMKKVSETNEKMAVLVEKIDRRQEVEDEIQRRRISASE